MEIRIIQYLLLFYASWIILSTILHYVALSALDPLTHITVKKDSAQWGLWYLKRISFIYLLYPVLFIAAIYFFQSDFNYRILLILLPVLAIPSLLIGVYQGTINMFYLNDLYFARIQRVSGLEIDANGFGISLFLLFPLCVLAILLVRRIWIKLFFILLLMIIGWCLYMSGSRTGVVGVLLFILLFPWIWIWADKKLTQRKRRFLLLCPLICFFFIGIVGVFTLQNYFSSSEMLVKRLNLPNPFYEKGVIEKTLRHSGRPNLALQAYRLLKLSPLSGWGPGGFYRSQQNIRFRNGEGYFFIFDNANNHYLQMSSELGILGSLFNFLFHTFPLWMVLRIRNEIHDKDVRIASGFVFITLCIMMLLYLTGPHTTFFSVMWIQVVVQSFLIGTAIKYGYSFKALNIKTMSPVIIVLSIVFLWGTYSNASGKEGYKARQKAEWWPYKYDKNCYLHEKWKEGNVRWCKKDAFLQTPLYINKDKIPKKIKLAIKVHHPDVASDPVTVRYGGKSGTFHELVIKNYAWSNIELPITEDNIFEFASPYNVTEKYFVLSLDVSRTWMPKEWGVNDDPRELGAAVLLNDKYFKHRWWSHSYEKNCYETENWGEGKVRWCKKEAFLQIPLITDEEKNIKEFTLAFKLNHPDIQLNPVTLSYGGKAGTLHQVVINNNAWNDIKIPVSEDYIFEFENPWNITERYFILSLDVSRTWVPKEWGVNDDPRELGVAVVISNVDNKLKIHPDLY
jgi:O-antigen ligase